MTTTNKPPKAAPRVAYFDHVADAIADVSLTDGVVVETKGYTVVNDGGGDQYIYHESGQSGETEGPGVIFGSGDSWFESTTLLANLTNLQKGYTVTTDSITTIGFGLTIDSTLDTHYLTATSEPTEQIYVDDLAIHDWTLEVESGLYVTAVWGQSTTEWRYAGTIYTDSVRAEPTKPAAATYYADSDSFTTVMADIEASGAGPVKLILEDGTYDINSLTVARSNLTIEARNTWKAIFSNAFDASGLTWALVDTNVYETTDTIPSQIDQVHVKYQGVIERLSGGQSGGSTAWDLTTLKDAAVTTGGWFIDGGADLNIRMPDDSDPSGNVFLTETEPTCMIFTGSNVWLEGIAIQYFGISGPTEGSQYNQDEYILDFRGDDIVLKTCKFQWNREQVRFHKCARVLVEDCYQQDGQRYMTYRQTRNSGGGTDGGSHLTCGRFLFNQCKQVTARNNSFFYVLQGLHFAGCQSWDAYGNTFERVRNIPIVVRQGTSSGGTDEQATLGGTVANNYYHFVGYGLPSNEGNDEGGPVWWINNRVDQFGWPGNEYDDDSIGSVDANRMGGTDNGDLLGLHFAYGNVIETKQEPSANTVFFGWLPASKDFAAGSLYYNNVWILPDPSAATNVAVWAHTSTDVAGTLDDVTFDHNQYWLYGGDENAFIQVNRDTIAQMRSNHPTFEPSGDYDHPVPQDGIATNPITKKTINGVTGNSWFTTNELTRWGPDHYLDSYESEDVTGDNTELVFTGAGATQSNLFLPFVFDKTKTYHLRFEVTLQVPSGLGLNMRTGALGTTGGTAVVRIHQPDSVITGWETGYMGSGDGTGVVHVTFVPNSTEDQQTVFLFVPSSQAADVEIENIEVWADDGTALEGYWGVL